MSTTERIPTEDELARAIWDADGHHPGDTFDTTQDWHRAIYINRAKAVLRLLETA